jgi:hypothetical protein
VIRSELSLGTEITKGGRIHWFQRIMLPELDPNDLAPKRVPADDADEGAAEFPINVTRKKSA